MAKGGRRKIVINCRKMSYDTLWWYMAFYVNGRKKRKMSQHWHYVGQCCKILSWRSLAVPFLPFPFGFHRFGATNTISGNARCLHQPSYKVISTYLQETAKNHWIPPIGCWSLGTCAKPNVTGSEGGDGCVHCVEKCDRFALLGECEESWLPRKKRKKDEENGKIRTVSNATLADATLVLRGVY